MNASYLVETAFLIPLLPALLALMKWRRLETYQRWFAILLWLIILISFLGEYFKATLGGNNLPFFHSYILVELLLLLIVFMYMFKEEWSKLVWLFLGGSFCIIWLLNVSIGNGWWSFPDYIHALEASIIIVLVSLWFIKMLREKKILNPHQRFEFWMCAGLLIYFTGNFLLFIFSKFILTAGSKVFNAIWMVNCVLIILLYSMYTIALLWVKKTNK